MSPIRIIILLLALAAAGGAALLVTQMTAVQVVSEAVSRTETLIQPREVPEAKVLIVTRDMEVGEVIQASDLKWVARPQSVVIEGHITQSGEVDAGRVVVGAVVRVPLYANEPIMLARLARRGKAGLLPDLMQPDMRAVAVEISPETASGGFILPNDRVDLILSYRQKASPTNGLLTDRDLSKTILQNVRVLAIDQGLTAGREKDGSPRSNSVGRTATLEVSPREAELVALAQSLGAISLVLRPFDAEALAAPRNPLYSLMDTETGPAGITVIRNGRASQAGIGGL